MKKNWSNSSPYVASTALTMLYYNWLAVYLKTTKFQLLTRRYFPLLAVALGGSLHVRRVGEDDGLGLGQDQDGRRVATVPVVETVGNVVSVVDLQSGQTRQ